MNVCDAQVILSPLAVPVLAEGENPINEGAGYSSKLASMFGLFVKDFKFPPVELGERGIYFLGDDYQLFMEMGLPIQIVSLPGHTPDSLGLILTESKQLFCGDAAMNAVISVAKHTIWIDDREQFQASWDKMISMDISKIYPSHGTPFSPKALIKNRHFLDTRKLFPMNK